MATKKELEEKLKIIKSKIVILSKDLKRIKKDAKNIQEKNVRRTDSKKISNLRKKISSL